MLARLILQLNIIIIILIFLNLIYIKHILIIIGTNEI